ncbi:MAG: hypothetical protein SOZ95_03455 [Bacilli bacterium]|nr:hypothetical protein [Bacilli bacterium]
MSKAPKTPETQIPKTKKQAKDSRWINALKSDDPQSLILTLFEENQRLKRELEQIKRVNYAIKKDMEDLNTRLIRERYQNIYGEDENTQEMELDN